MTVLSAINRILLVAAVLGLVLAPMARPAISGDIMAVAAAMPGMSEQMVADSEVGATDDMPCCPGKPSLPDCSKDCPFMALCGAIVLHGVSLNGLIAPLTLVAVILPGDPSALVSLAHAPPRKPPKA
jgi:hypothetical protein